MISFQQSSRTSHLSLLDCFWGTGASFIFFSLMGELLKSSRLSVSFLDSLMGERGVLTLSLEVPLLLYSLSASTEVGEVGDLGERGAGGEVGDGEKMESSLGVLSILMMGVTPSTDLDLFAPCGEGDRERRTLRDPKPAL